ncbi:hypothetical protein ACN9M0_36250 [Streptomyces sp. R-07]|uniref:hypothetical protein n=1 Tax=Streptomyces sp. R-07 TaxID=3404052 RepID=UPI003CF81D04
MTLVCVPHLDYDLQRHGPESPQAREAARELDAALAPCSPRRARPGSHDRRALRVRHHQELLLACLAGTPGGSLAAD